MKSIYSNFDKKELIEKLDQHEDKLKLIYMWMKQDCIDLKMFKYLIEKIKD